jgi:hypothetical protein
MAGQTARALQGSFNTVPVLHSNQPEAVNGPGILIDTSPGIAYSETGLAMVNPPSASRDPSACISTTYIAPPAQNRIAWVVARNSASPRS